MKEDELLCDIKILLEVLRPVAVIGNNLVHNKDIWEFLAPSGYRKAYEVYNKIKSKYDCNQKVTEK